VQAKSVRRFALAMPSGGANVEKDVSCAKCTLFERGPDPWSRATIDYYEVEVNGIVH